MTWSELLVLWLAAVCGHVVFSLIFGWDVFHVVHASYWQAVTLFTVGWILRRKART